MARTTNPELMRQRIITAAIDVFGRLGFHRATIADVATAAELAKGTLYLYFRSKEAILIAGYRHYADRIVSRAEAKARESRPDVRARLLALVEASWEGIDELRAGYPLYFEFLSLATHPRYEAQVRSILAGLYRRYHGFVEQLLRKGIADGELRRDVPVGAVAAAVGACFDGYCIQRQFCTEAPARADAVVALKWFLKGVASSPQAEREGVADRLNR